jgi:hypothetical protein
MSPVPFEISNNWKDHPDLRRFVVWIPVDSQLSGFICIAQSGTSHWAVRMNDFPDEPLYTLLIENEEIIHFDDWPSFWGKPPLFSQLK